MTKFVIPKDFTQDISYITSSSGKPLCVEGYDADGNKVTETLESPCTLPENVKEVRIVEVKD